jgi:hypothetical protein
MAAKDKNPSWQRTGHEGQEADGASSWISVARWSQAPRTIWPLERTIIEWLANTFYNPEEGILCFVIHRAVALP